MAEDVSPMIYPLVPQDAALLAAIGRVAICHGFLDHVLRRTVKTLSGISLEEADLALAREGSAVLRDMIRRIASRKFGREHAATLKIRALLARCERVTARRNSIIHDLYAQQLDGAAMVISRDSTSPLPAVADVDSLATNIFAVAAEINAERQKGFIAEAIVGTQGTKLLDQVKREVRED